MTPDGELTLVPDPDFHMIGGGEPAPGEGFRVVDRSSGNAIGTKAFKKFGLTDLSVTLEPPFQDRSDPRFEPGELVSLVPESASHLPAVFGVWDHEGEVRIGTTSEPRAVALAKRGESAAGVILGVVHTPGEEGRSRTGMQILMGPRDLLEAMLPS